MSHGLLVSEVLVAWATEFPGAKSGPKLATNFDLFDLELFREKLERILREQHHSETDLGAVRIFLEAWRARRNGSDD